MCSACHLMVFNICVKFHENMSSCFKVMERTQKLLTDTHTHKKKTKTIYPIALHTSYARGITRVTVLHVVSWFSICVKFNENMSSGFKIMERTLKLLTHEGQ